MNVNVGSYNNPWAVGYTGWVKFDKFTAYEKLDGEIVITPN